MTMIPFFSLDAWNISWVYVLLGNVLFFLSWFPLSYSSWKDPLTTIFSLHQSYSHHVAPLVCQSLHLHCCTEPTSVARLRALMAHHHSLTTTDCLPLAPIIIVMLIIGQDKYSLSHLCSSWSTEQREYNIYISAGFWDLMLVEKCCINLVVLPFFRAQPQKTIRNDPGFYSFCYRTQANYIQDLQT